MNKYRCGYSDFDEFAADIIAESIATGDRQGTNTAPDGLVHSLMRGRHLALYEKFLVGMFNASVCMGSRWDRVAAFRKAVNNDS